MSKYVFKAKDWSGKVVKGVLELSSKQQVIESIKDSGLIPLSINEVKTTFFDNIYKAVMGRVTSKHVLNFTRQLSTMMKAGLPLTDALLLLRNQDGEDSGMFEICNYALNTVRSGQSLGKALSRYHSVFGDAYVASIGAGEEGGVLEDVLLRLADNLEKSNEFSGKVKSAMIYPVIVVIGMVAVVIIMMIFVIPQLMVLYKDFDAKMPLMTRVLMSVSVIVSQFWFLLPLVFFMIYFVIKIGSSSSAFRANMDRVKYNYPIMGDLMRKTVIADTTRTLAMLLTSGITLVDALKIVSNVADSQLYKDAYLQVAEKVQKGFSMADSFEYTQAFPIIVNQMVATGEATGKLDEVLNKVSEYFSQEAEQSVKTLTAAIEPIIMIVLGIGVAFLVVAVIMPIYNLTSSF